jgi:hypothetical protein
MNESAITTPHQLPPVWRAKADVLRKHGAPGQATAVEALAEELDQVLRSELDVVLTLTDAAGESGYSAEHLGREVRQGRISNAGRQGAPRIRRGDLPRKAPCGIAASRTVTYDAGADARSLLAGRLHTHGGAHDG